MNRFTTINRPQEYTCIDPVKGGDLLDFFNGALDSKTARAFEAHLFLCHECQNTFLRLDTILAVLRDDILASPCTTTGGLHNNLEKQRRSNKAMSKHCHPGLDDRCRDNNGQIREKNSNTRIDTLRQTYGDNFAQGIRGDAHLGTLLDRTGSNSLSDYLKKRK